MDDMDDTRSRRASQLEQRSYQRAQRDRHRSAEARSRSADGHERAARLHDRLADLGWGDVEQHRRQAGVHRNDADADRFPTTPQAAPDGRPDPPAGPASC
jgi:hypothetical protein